MKRIRTGNKVTVFIIAIALLCTSGFCAINRVNAVSGSDEMHKVNKDETVYVNLNHDGTVSKINVVNHFSVKEAGVYQDYGKYENVINLTNDVKPVVEDNTIEWELSSPAEDFYYQGQMANGELPWLFDIKYELDGKEVKADELPGTDGQLTITINVNENKAAEDYFRKKYMMQITVPLSMQNCTLISAPDAVQMIAGKTKTLAYTVLPGTSHSFVIQTQVHDFTMESMDITIIKEDLSASLQNGEMTEGFSEMSDGMEGLVNGTIQLEDGMTGLSGGISKIADGMKELSLGTPQLADGMDKFGDGLQTFADKMNELSSGSDRINEGLQGLAENGGKISAGYEGIKEGMSSLLSQKQELSSLAIELAKSKDPETAQLAQAVLGQLEGMSQLQDGLEDLNNNLDVYTQGVAEAAEQYGVFNSGINELPQGAGQLTEGYKEIENGNQNVYSAINELSKGLSDVDNAAAAIPEKTRQLVDGQQKIKDGIDEAVKEIETLTGADSSQDGSLPVSFAAPGKAVPNSVQFLLRTPSIEKENETVVSVEAEEKSMSFWEKLLNLFRA